MRKFWWNPGIARERAFADEDPVPGPGKRTPVCPRSFGFGFVSAAHFALEDAPAARRPRVIRGQGPPAPPGFLLKHKKEDLVGAPRRAESLSAPHLSLADSQDTRPSRMKRQLVLCTTDAEGLAIIQKVEELTPPDIGAPQLQFNALV
jgi:hypothetical protein